MLEVVISDTGWTQIFNRSPLLAFKTAVLGYSQQNGYRLSLSYLMQVVLLE